MPESSGTVAVDVRGERPSNPKAVACTFCRGEYNFLSFVFHRSLVAVLVSNSFMCLLLRSP